MSLFLAAQPVVVHVSTHLSTGEKVAAIVAAIFTAIGGIGAATSAFFSWRSARASGATARDAREALAASLKPQVKLRIFQDPQPDGLAVARAVVLGPLSPMGLTGVMPAADVRIEVNLASGKPGSSESIPLLEPNPESWAREPPYLSAVIGELSDDWPPPEGDRATVTVSFSDVRGAGRHELSQSVGVRRHQNAGTIYFTSATDPTEPPAEPTERRVIP